VPKDWEVGLVVVGDGVFSILPKILDWETVLGTLGDALIPFFFATSITFTFI
jgi:hypothetical protein